MGTFKKVLIIFCALGSIVCLNFQVGKHGNKQSIFDKFDSTCGLRNVIIIFDYTGMRIEGSKLFMNCSYTVKQDVLKDPNVTITIDRCKNKENLDTCEQFRVVKLSRYCPTIELFAPLTSTFYSKFEPEWKCPIKKGVYRAKESMVDMSAGLILPFDSWYWKAKVEMHDRDTNKLLMCLKVEARLN